MERGLRHIGRSVFIYTCVIFKMCLLVLLRRPYKLTLLMSDGCNLRCRVCSFWKKKNITLALHEVEAIWQAFPIKPCWINITGGEPTTNPDLEKILVFFVRLHRPLFITVTTNGFNNPTGIVERALRYNKKALLYISVSMDGDAQLHDAIRGVPNAWSNAYRTFQDLSLLKAAFPQLTVGVSITVSELNFYSVLPFFRQIVDETQAVNINLVQSSRYYDNVRSDTYKNLPREQLIALLREIQYCMVTVSFSGVLKTLFLDMAVRRLKGASVRLPCASYYSNVLITSQLQIMDCVPRFASFEKKRASRSECLASLAQTIRAPRARRQALKHEIARSRCEADCLTPCETYIHLIAALLSPHRFPGLMARFFAVYTSAFLKKALRRNLSRSRTDCESPVED